MKKILSLVLVFILLLFTLVACDGNASLTFATGGSQGTYYAYGTVISEYISNNSDVVVTAITGNGSKSNVEDLDAGDVQLAFCQSDVMSYAYNGESLFDQKVDSFSVVAALYSEQVQIVTCNPDIKSVADLKGKTISIGAQGSGTYFNAMDILGVYGISIDDITPQFLDFGDSTEALKDNKIDAAFVVAGAPTNSIVELATSNKNAHLVSLDSDHAAKLVADSPYYSAEVIGKDVYGFNDDTDTVAVVAMVIARDDVSEDAIYNFVKTLFEGKNNIQHAKANLLDANYATSVTAVPFHSGAAKFFKELGIEVKTK